jgi:hypothetical protein
MRNNRQLRRISLGSEFYSMRRPLFGCVLLLALLSCAHARALHGQGPRLPSPFVSAEVSIRLAPVASAPDSTPRKGTYWVEGGLLGAIGAVALAQLVNGLGCEGSCGGNKRVFLFLVGGFVVGSLVGGGIEKKL